MKLLRRVGWMMALSLAGCGPQSVTDGAPSSPRVDGGSSPTVDASTDATGVTGATGAIDAAGANDASPLSPVQLVYGANSKIVDLASLPTQSYKGAVVVPLNVVWAAGGLGDASGLRFDFEGDDGFRPSSRTDCVPLAGATLVKGYLLPDSRALIWDDTLGLFGCYSVHGVAKITGLDADAGAE